MSIQLHGIDQMPRDLPFWQSMMDDLCHPPAERVARVLDLGLRTVQRYNASGNAPRAVCLAVFWLTSWGRNAVHTQAHNDAVLLATCVDSLRLQVAALEGQIQGLMQLGDFGAANDPSAAQRFTRLPRELLR